MVPARLCNQGQDSKLQCPLCEYQCLPITLRKHLYQSHGTQLSVDEINVVYEEILTVDKPSNTSTIVALESHPLYTRVEPDGRVACKAPECDMRVSAQNIAR